jgi:Ring finger domain
VSWLFVALWATLCVVWCVMLLCRDARNSREERRSRRRRRRRHGAASNPGEADDSDDISLQQRKQSIEKKMIVHEWVVSEHVSNRAAAAEGCCDAPEEEVTATPSTAAADRALADLQEQSRLQPTQQQRFLRERGGEEEEGDKDYPSSSSFHTSLHTGCAICFASFKDHEQVCESTECTHRFHKECMVAWLVRCRHSDCPVCRSAWK